MAFSVTGSTTVADVRDGAQGPQGPAGNDGTNGTDGNDAPRYTTRRLYRTTATDISSSPPSATITWSTGALSSITTNWTETAPTIDASNSASYWFSDIVFSDATGAATSTTATGSNPQRQTTFSGVVTFTSANTISDGTDSQTFGGLASANAVNTGQVTGAGNLISANAVNTGQVTGAGNLISANAVDAANQVNSLNAGNVSGLGNLATDNTTLGTLATSNTTLGNIATANVINGTNQITADTVTAAQLTNNIRTDIGAGTGNGNSNLSNTNVSITMSKVNDAGGLATANAVNTGQVSGAGNLISANAVNVSNQVNGIGAGIGNMLTTANAADARTQIGAGTGNGNGNGNGNSNLTNNNISINAARVNDFTSTVQTTNIDGGYINTGVVAGGNLTIDSTNFQPQSGQGFALGTSGGTGRFAVGDAGQHMWWDGTSLRIQGQITQVSPEILSAATPVVGDWTALTSSTTLTGIPDGLYIFVLVGGGGGGASTNGKGNGNGYRGGGGGGMAIFATNYDGTSSLQYNHGSGGTGGVNSGNSGGTSQLVMGGTVIAQANGGGGGRNNLTPNGGTATVNIANNNAASAYFNNNSNKGRAGNSLTGRGGGGVCIPTLEDYDSNLTSASANDISSGGSMLGNQTVSNGSGNNNQYVNSNYISGYAAYPQIFAAAADLGGRAYANYGANSGSGGTGGRFAGGGGARSYYGAGGGAGGTGGGGGGATTSHNDYNASGGAGGPGALYYRKA